MWSKRRCTVVYVRPAQLVRVADRRRCAGQPQEVGATLVHEDGRVGAAVERVAQRLEALLARRVPHLQRDELVVDLDLMINC